MHSPRWRRARQRPAARDHGRSAVGDAVVRTHLHVDYVGWNTMLGDSVKPIFDAGLVQLVGLDHVISPKIRLKTAVVVKKFGFVEFRSGGSSFS
jgi:hypothetical protein